MALCSALVSEDALCLRTKAYTPHKTCAHTPTTMSHDTPSSPSPPPPLFPSPLPSSPPPSPRCTAPSFFSASAGGTGRAWRGRSGARASQRARSHLQQRRAPRGAPCRQHVMAPPCAPQLRARPHLQQRRPPCRAPHRQHRGALAQARRPRWRQRRLSWRAPRKQHMVAPA